MLISEELADVGTVKPQSHSCTEISLAIQILSQEQFNFRNIIIKLQVVIHMMPDLPNVGLERDIEQFVELFENPDFR